MKVLLDTCAIAEVRKPKPDVAVIAATALRHGLRVMTRNAGDFLATGVHVVNPWRADQADGTE